MLRKHTQSFFNIFSLIARKLAHRMPSKTTDCCHFGNSHQKIQNPFLIRAQVMTTC